MHIYIHFVEIAYYNNAQCYYNNAQAKESVTYIIVHYNYRTFCGSRESFESATSMVQIHSSPAKSGTHTKKILG